MASVWIIHRCVLRGRHIDLIPEQDKGVNMSEDSINTAFYMLQRLVHLMIKGAPVIPPNSDLLTASSHYLIAMHAKRLRWI